MNGGQRSFSTVAPRAGAVATVLVAQHHHAITAISALNALSEANEIIEISAYNAGTPLELPMATLTIRDLDDALKQSLRIRAAHRSRSMEEEARQILRTALLDTPAPGTDLAQRIRSRFAALGDVVLPATEREPMRPAPAFAARATPPCKSAARKPARKPARQDR